MWKIKTFRSRDASILSFVAWSIIVLNYKKLNECWIKIHKWILCYITEQPFGFKQNTIIKNLFRVIFSRILVIENGSDISYPIYCCAYIISTIYSVNIRIIVEVFDLTIKERTYNPLKRRYDSIILKPDQVILSVILISLTIIILTNIVLLYIYFTLVVVGLEIISILYRVSIEIRSNYNFISILCAATKESIFKKGFIRRMITGRLFEKHKKGFLFDF